MGISRFLGQKAFTSKDLWLQVKSKVREVEETDGVLIFDDTIQEKQWTDENEIICWHYDHVKGRIVKGFNLLNCLYHVANVSIPVAFELIPQTNLVFSLENQTGQAQKHKNQEWTDARHALCLYQEST